MGLELVFGAVSRVLFKEIGKVKKNYERFKTKLKELEETLALLNPEVGEIEKFDRQLHNKRGSKTISFRKLLEDGNKLVSECSKIPIWNIVKQDRYSGKLVDLHNKILKSHTFKSQAQMGRDLKQVLQKLQKIEKRIMANEVEVNDASSTKNKSDAKSSTEKKSDAKSSTEKKSDAKSSTEKKKAMLKGKASSRQTMP